MIEEKPLLVRNAGQLSRVFLLKMHLTVHKAILVL